MHVGASNGTFHNLGQKSGEETHTLSGAEMPQHDHELIATNAQANNPSPKDHLPAQVAATLDFIYSSGSDNLDVNLGSTTVANVGGGQAHNNMQPYLAVNFCIALRGLFPSRN